MNILFTCVGRRNYLVGYFRDALRPGDMVFAADAKGHAPALSEADRSFVVPPASDPAYCGVLVKLCRDNGVSLLIPLTDFDLPKLARHRRDFLAVGTTPLVSSEEVVDTCRDKWRTTEFGHRIGLSCPLTFLALDDAKLAHERNLVSYPLVIKPRRGSASVGVELVHCQDELELAFRLAGKRIQRTMLDTAGASALEKSVLIQEHLKGEEYGLDVVNDLEGRHRVVFARRKLSMRAGETDRAETVVDRVLMEAGRRIGERLGHVGCLDCDVFAADGRVCLLEMNPRFGGGYPFSHVAGANLPAAIVSWACGEEANPEWLKAKPGVISAKCDRLVEVDHGVPQSHDGQWSDAAAATRLSSTAKCQAGRTKGLTGTGVPGVRGSGLRGQESGAGGRAHCLTGATEAKAEAGSQMSDRRRRKLGATRHTRKAKRHRARGKRHEARCKMSRARDWGLGTRGGGGK